MSTELQNYLTAIAEQNHDTGEASVIYKEHTNPDAICGDEWLEKGTSYIWKVGTLALVDSNKCDWVILLIGHKRSENAKCEHIGTLHWLDGENDDIGRCLDRYLDCARELHPVFYPD